MVLFSYFIKKFNIVVAASVVSVLWSLLHYFNYPVIELGYIFFMGLVLTGIFLYAKNLAYPILLHMVINGFLLFS